MRRHEAYPGRFLKAADVAKPTIVTIRSVSHEVMNDGKLKPTVFVDKFQKAIVVNVTNSSVLYDLAGTDDDANWPGVTVEVFTEMARMPGKEPAPSIRFRKPPQRPAKVPAEPASGEPLSTVLNDDIPFSSEWRG